MKPMEAVFRENSPREGEAWYKTTAPPCCLPTPALYWRPFSRGHTGMARLDNSGKGLGRAMEPDMLQKTGWQCKQVMAKQRV